MLVDMPGLHCKSATYLSYIVRPFSRKNKKEEGAEEEEEKKETQGLTFAFVHVFSIFDDPCFIGIQSFNCYYFS